VWDKGLPQIAAGQQIRRRIIFWLFGRGPAGFTIQPFMEAHLKTIFIIAVIALFAAPAARAQMLVDPAKVAPEYREAAEKRRAEQLRQRECGQKANLEKILPRDRTAFLNHCLEELAAKQ
jgi:hypothetical protein